MTGLEALLAYLISLAASLRGTAIDEGRRSKLQKKLEEEAAFFRNVQAMRPLREEIDRVGINVASIKAELGIRENEDALFSLVKDSVFQDDLSKWLLAKTPEVESEQLALLSRHFLGALETTDPSTSDVERIQQDFLDLAEKQVFSNPMLSAWRNDVRTRSLQNQVADEGKATREAVKAGIDEVVDTIKVHVGPLIQTTADDIRRLRRLSEDNINSILRLAEIRVNDSEVKVDRAVVHELCRVIDNGSLLAVGDPGSGKSIVLCDAAQKKRREGFEAIFLDVQRIQSASLGNLRNELGLAHEIIEVFADWPGRDPAFLFVDALDAARSDPAGRMVRDLLLEIDTLARWNVVATVRKFDLRYADDIKRIFCGAPASEVFRDAEFSNLRHLNVPLFSDSELVDVSKQSAVISELIQSANEVLRDLLRVPFNLRLAADILASGAGLGELTPIRTQLELLNRHWRIRVIQGNGGGDARESVTFRAALAMVNKRSLTIPRSEISGDPSASVPLHELLSANVLAEWVPPGLSVADRYTLAFSHNILFDFAAEKALFRGQPDRLIDKLTAEPDLVLAIRPSAAFHFQRLWSESQTRTRFWQTTLSAAQSPDLPKISQLIGPTVAVELTRDLADFDLLFAALEGNDATQREAAANVIQHIVGTLLAKSTPLTGEEAGPWIQWIERVSEHLDHRTAGAVRNLVWSCFND